MPINSSYLGRKSTGYTLVEMMVSIAIMSIMMGIIGFNYNKDRNYQILKLETQRIASAIRAVRSRDFNGVIQPVCADLATKCTLASDCSGTCTSIRPALGYGLHFEQVYKVCDNATSKSCYDDADCPDSACGTSNLEGRSSYVLFADFKNSADGNFDGGKSGAEFIQEFKLPKDFKPFFANGAGTIDVNYTQAEILFNSRTLAYKTYQTPTWSSQSMGANGLIIELKYAPNGTVVCGSQTRYRKGKITTNAQANSINDEMIAC
jgi:prepilin-type N-terminal cleavage/methylation domain-containing protein